MQEWEGRMNVGMSNSVATAIRGSVRDMAIGKPRTTEKADRAIVEQDIDPRTRMVLFKMLNRGVFNNINGCISTGKENAPLNDEIERRIHKKPVICYVKHYEKNFRGTIERSCPIVKLYTQEDIAAARTHTESQSPSSTTPADPLAQSAGSLIKDKQFFSPNTKSVLDEVTGNTRQLQQSPSQSFSPKRSLLFPELCIQDLCSTPPPETTSGKPALATGTSTSAERTESPGKKIKGNEDI